MTPGNAEKSVGEVTTDRTEPGGIWTLTTWLVGDPPEGFGYGYGSQDAAERNGRYCEVAARRFSQGALDFGDAS